MKSKLSWLLLSALWGLHCLIFGVWGKVRNLWWYETSRHFKVQVFLKSQSSGCYRSCLYVTVVLGPQSRLPPVPSFLKPRPIKVKYFMSLVGPESRTLSKFIVWKFICLLVCLSRFPPLPNLHPGGRKEFFPPCLPVFWQCPLYLGYLVLPGLLPLAQILMPPNYYTCLLQLPHLPESQPHYASYFLPSLTGCKMFSALVIIGVQC